MAEAPTPKRTSKKKAKKQISAEAREEQQPYRRSEAEKRLDSEVPVFTPQLQSTEMERAIQQLAEFMGQQAMKHDEEMKQILKTQNRMIDQLREPRELWEPRESQE